MSRLFIFIYFFITFSVSAFGLESQNSINQMKSFSDLEELSRIEASITGQMGLILLDSSRDTERVFVSADFKKWIVIKPEIVIIDKTPGTVLAGSKNSRYFYLNGKKNYFFIISGFDESRDKSNVKIISNALKSHVKTAKNLSVPLQMLSALMTRAEAKEGTCLGSDSSGNSKPVTSDDFKYIKGVWGCMKGAGIGFWDSTGGIVTSLVSFGAGAGKSVYCVGRSMVTGNFSTPLCSELADNIENSVNSVFHLIYSTKEVLGEALEGFNDLPGPLRAKLGCEVASSLATTGALVYFTAGAGAPAAAARLISILEKLKNTSEYANNSKKIDAMIESLKQRKTKLAASEQLPADIQSKKDQVQWAQGRYNMALSEEFHARGALEAAQRPKHLSLERARKTLDHELDLIKRRPVTGLDPIEISRMTTEILDHGALTDGQIKLLEKLKQSSMNLGGYQIVEDGYPYRGINQITQSTYKRQKKELDKLFEQATEKFVFNGIPLSNRYTYANEAEWIAYENGSGPRKQAMQKASAELRMRDRDLKKTIDEYNRLVDKKIVNAEEKKALTMRAITYGAASGCETARTIKDSTIQGTRSINSDSVNSAR